MSRGARGTAGVPPHAHLDARDQIAVAPNDANALARIEEPQIGAFADRHGCADSEDAGKGDIEVGDDTQRRWLDHMAAESVERAGAGAAGVHEGRCPAPSRHFDRFDTEGGSAPVDMSVEVDEPRHDEQPMHIDDIGIAGGEVAPDFSYFSVAEGDVGGLVASARRVDDVAVLEDQIRHTHASGKTC